MFWVIAAGLAALVLIMLVLAGYRARGAAASAPSGHDLAVYEDQLAELERDRNRGLIGGTEAEAAEAEIKRRMLALADDGKADLDGGDGQASRQPVGRLWAVAVLVPLAGVALYVTIGRPDLASGPVAQARGPTAADMRRAANMSPQERAQMIRGMVEGLAARLKENPNDFAGWMRLGRAWSVLRQWTKAAAAYRQALRVKPKDPAALEGFIASRLRSLPPRTPLPPDLREAVGQLALIRPGHPLALYFGGVIAAEARKYKIALGLWRALLAKLPAKSPLAPVLRRRIAAVEKAQAAQEKGGKENGGNK